MLSQGGFSLTALPFSAGHQVDSVDRPSYTLIAHIGIGHHAASILRHPKCNAEREQEPKCSAEMSEILWKVQQRD